MVDQNEEVIEGDAPKIESQPNPLQARVAELEAELKKRTDEAAQRRIAKREAEAEAAKALEAKGEYEKAAELREKRLAELEALEPDAKSWQELQERKRKELDSKISGLSPEDQELIRTVPSLAAQEQLLARITATPSAPELNPESVQGTPSDPGPELAPEEMSPEQLAEWAQKRAAAKKRAGGFSMFRRGQ